MLTSLLSLYILILLSCLPSVTPAPAIPSTSIVSRQDGNVDSNPAPFQGPTTLTTVSTTETAAGLITQTCQITLTPIIVNGQNAVQEDKKCSQTVGGAPSSNGNNNTGNDPNPSTSISSSTASSVSILSPTSVSSSVDSPSSTATTTSPSGSSSNIASPTDASVIGQSASSAASPANSGLPDGVSVIGQSSVTGVVTSLASTVTPTSNLVSPTDVSVLGQSSTASATSAADQSATSSQSAAFTIPGKKLQVLPIGLGVFAGISVIALIVVGLVTYERTKYRRTFRQRKLAEAAAPLGYGGMAERS